MGIGQDRAAFNEIEAPALAKKVKAAGDVIPGPSDRFLFIENAGWLTVVAGPQEERLCDLALPYGLGTAKGRRLRVVLPDSESGATVLRSTWLNPERQPEIWTYGGGKVSKARVQSPKKALEQFAAWIDPEGRTLAEVREDEFREASVPRHFGKRGELIRPLVDAIAERSELDPAHRKGYRAWHYCGQKVLEIRGKSGGALQVRAGILNQSGEQVWMLDRPVTPRQVDAIMSKVTEGVAARAGGTYSKPDEHWLQSALRRDPRSVGIEGRAIREVPAWRRAGAAEPTSQPGAWGRGYIDLLGVDAHGTIQIVETKVASNDDPMFVLQGIDYLAYCQAYRRPITRRLDVHERAPMAVRYVVGVAENETAKINRFAAATLHALHPDVTFNLVGLTGWYGEPAPVRTLPQVSVAGAGA